jgi:prepilin-type N-terminal cleavage/methylation domain-containing protein
MNKRWAQKQKGFTIVELLIVVVVIGIIAAIVLVSYGTVQARAGNAARIASATQAVKILRGYIASYGTQPIGNGAYCMTVDSVCTNYNGTVVATNNSTMVTELRKVGNPPSSMQRGSATNYGLYYDSYSPRTYEGAAAPVLVMYWLDGQNVDCKLPTVVFSSGDNYVASTNKWTSSSATMTSCWVTVN